MVHPIELALKRDLAVGPELVHQFDLLRLATPPHAPVLTQRLVFDGIPPRPNSQAQPAAGDDIELGRLFGNQGGLPLRQNQDPAGEADPLSHRRDVRHGHKDFMERVVHIKRPITDG